MSGSRKLRRSGFTLTEMLIVLGMICVLAAIILPVFSRVRENSYNTTCRSNLKQIYLAIQQYTSDNNGLYPVLMEQSTGKWWSNRLAPYLKDDRLLRCPGVPPNPTRYSSLFDDTSYSFNTWRLNDRSHPSFALIGMVSKSEAAVTFNTASIWLNYCMTQFINGRYSAIRMRGVCGQTFKFHESRHHQGGTNWSFLDGHVKWMTPQQIADLECDNPPLPKAAH